MINYHKPNNRNNTTIIYTIVLKNNANKLLKKNRKIKILNFVVPYIFLASSTNLAKPISVKGCFSKPKIESNGDVQTSAPAAAHFTI